MFFCGQFADMKDIKYLQKMDELKEEYSNDVHSVLENEDLLDSEFCSIVPLTTHRVVPTWPCDTCTVYPVSELSFDGENNETEPQVDESMTERDTNPATHLAPDLQNRPDREINRTLLPNPASV